MPLNKILIVEDEPDIQMIAAIGLKDIGKFEIKIANNGMEALELLPNWRPDLILMDVMMPVMDGLSTIKKFKDNPDLKNIPVIFMTARNKDEETGDYGNTGAIDVIIKPFDPLNLADYVRKVWERTQCP